MENNKKRHAFGVTFTGDVTFQGPMFDIHDNEHVHISAEKMPHEEQVDDQMEMATDITQLPQVEEELNYFQPRLHLKRLLEMEWFGICRTKPIYTQKWIEGLVDGLLDHCCDWTEERCGLLTMCTASYHDDGAGRHTNITYGDYFLTEALAKLNGQDPMLWI